MIVKRENSEFNYGYTAITEINGRCSDMLMDFGILKLKKGDSYQLYSDLLESAILILYGKANLFWEDRSVAVSRSSLFDQSPWCLHFPKGVKVKVEAIENCEFVLQQTDNDRNFKSKLYTPQECRSEIFGEGVLNGTSTRTVRTVFDYNNAPYSNMVIGEVINHAGRWSSYPPHDHPQPEIYHYRFLDKSGFGVSIIEDQAFVGRDGDTVCIPPGKVHPQVTAPGYPMWYCWMIRHLPGDPFIDRFFRDEHKWLLNENVKIWPEK